MDAPKPWTSWLGGLAVAVTVGALCFCKAQDPDLGFHFATGRAVLALGKVPGTNVLSYTHPDHPWLLHQWAPAVLFELVRRRFSVEGVTVVKAVVVVATWLVSFVTVRRLFSRSVALGATLVVAGATAASFRFVERPLIFSNLALALVGLAIAAVLQEPDARRRRRHLAGAVAVTVVASHLHA
ncbi:MAG: hypothetical protein JNL79_28755, partial [Myxococcales bacterium]|nr:hypothetical protein [Myxococcales bacterium]